MRWPVHAASVRNYFFLKRLNCEPCRMGCYLILLYGNRLMHLKFFSSDVWDIQIFSKPSSWCSRIFFSNLSYSIKYSFVPNRTWYATSWRVTYWTVTLKIWRIPSNVIATMSFEFQLLIFGFGRKISLHLCSLFSRVFLHD